MLNVNTKRSLLNYIVHTYAVISPSLDLILEDLPVHILIRYIIIDLRRHLQGNNSYLHEDKVINILNMHLI